MFDNDNGKKKKDYDYVDITSEDDNYVDVISTPVRLLYMIRTQIQISNILLFPQGKVLVFCLHPIRESVYSVV